MHDSRRYHRQRRPRFERRFSFGGGSSGGETVSPFGGLPYREAGLARKQFSTPLSQGFGFGGGKGSPYAYGQGPLATFINQSRGVLGDYIPQQQNLATQITTGANKAYGGYQQAVDQFMQQLPGFNQTAAQATGAAKTSLEDAMSPLPSRATYQEAARRALASARTGEAARGMVEGGQAGAQEQGLLSDLAFNTMQSDAANRQQAIQGLGGALQGQEQTAGLGQVAQQALFNAYPQLASLLSGASQMPQQAMGNLLQFLTAANDPTYSLLRMVLPSVASRSSQYNVGVLSG